MNVVDSSGWIEYFFGGPNSGFFRPPLHDMERLIVPTIVLYEVVRHITRAAGRGPAQEAAAQMQRAKIADLDAPLAYLAARLSSRHNLPMADSIVYAAAQHHSAKLYTQDADFEKIPGVKYVRKKR
jgi:predicted nucleic acid-binding protein